MTTYKLTTMTAYQLRSTYINYRTSDSLVKLSSLATTVLTEHMTIADVGA